MTARDTRDSEHPTTYIKSNAIDFAREMLYRHAIVLRGVARDIKINCRSFILKRPDSSHLVIWSSQTEFLNTEVYCQWWTLPFQAASACLPKFSANLAGDS